MPVGCYFGILDHLIYNPDIPEHIRLTVERIHFIWDKQNTEKYYADLDKYLFNFEEKKNEEIFDESKSCDSQGSFISLKDIESKPIVTPEMKIVTSKMDNIETLRPLRPEISKLLKDIHPMGNNRTGILFEVYVKNSTRNF
jgi:hypothetical protein